MAEPRLIRPDSPGLPYRIRPGADVMRPLVLMLHGWGGDENAMWVFETVLPETWWLAAMRGPFALAGGGYQWTAGAPSADASVADFTAGVAALMPTLVDLEAHFGLARQRVVLMGFSQGAALAYAVPSLGRWRPAAIVSLAGFLPGDVSFDFTGLPIFWGHGIRDEIVPVGFARDGVERLRGAGARVHYCEADVSHKVGVECARGLKQWISQSMSASSSGL